MRKLSFLIIVCFSTLLFSCKDDLDVSPFDRLEESKALQTPTDFTIALRGTYLRLLGGVDGDYYPRKNILADVLSDNLIISQAGRRSLQSYYQFKLDANSTWGSGLFYSYGTIDRANRIIENINNLPDGPFKNDVLAQAKALRALGHFDAVTSFAPSFLAVDPNSPNSGVPIKSSSDAADLPARATLNQTFDFIISELVESKSLAANHRTSVASGFMNQAAISALLTRVYLYKGDFAQAKAEAESAISLIGSADIAIGSIEEFPKIWKDNSAGNAGVLFKVLVTEQDNVFPGTEYSQTSPGAGVRSEYVPTLELYNLYSDSDVRKSSYFLTSAYNGSLYNNIIKYSSRPASSANVVDVKVLRGAEVYLSLAEAAYNTGDEAAALQALDAVRSRRYTDFTSPQETGSQLYDAIMLERRLELAFEGHRYYDLKRLGLPIRRSATEGEIADGSGLPAPADTRFIPGNDYRFTMPIPTEERQANPNFAQSPNY